MTTSTIWNINVGGTTVGLGQNIRERAWGRPRPCQFLSGGPPEKNRMGRRCRTFPDERSQCRDPPKSCPRCAPVARRKVVVYSCWFGGGALLGECYDRPLVKDVPPLMLTGLRAIGLGACGRVPLGVHGSRQLRPDRCPRKGNTEMPTHTHTTSRIALRPSDIGDITPGTRWGVGVGRPPPPPPEQAITHETLAPPWSPSGRPRDVRGLSLGLQGPAPRNLQGATNDPPAPRPSEANAPTMPDAFRMHYARPRCIPTG